MRSLTIPSVWIPSLEWSVFLRILYMKSKVYMKIEIYCWSFMQSIFFLRNPGMLLFSGLLASKLRRSAAIVSLCSLLLQAITGLGCFCSWGSPGLNQKTSIHGNFHYFSEVFSIQCTQLVKSAQLDLATNALWNKMLVKTTQFANETFADKRL